ncbi:MAG: glycoside hydrolase family 16 protein [Chitinophagaceae bacterium]
MNVKILFASILISISISSQAQDGYKIVFQDEFNYKGLPDSTKWNYDVGGHGWGNQELQFYTKNRKENANVSKGYLVIEARKEPWEVMNFTSARLTTKNKADWKYGKVMVRAKLPKGRGTWPAIWMLATMQNMKWPDDGEIDIMEHVGFDPGRIHASVHCKSYNHIIGTQKTKQIMLPDFSDKFHVYEVEWDQDTVKVGVDGTYYFSFSNEKKGYGEWPFDNPMHLLLNIAVGGGWGGQKGVDESIWPVKMTVDYVRVYQKN